MIELVEDILAEDNCFSAADMADQAAKAFRHGYERAILDVTEQLQNLIKQNDNDTQRTNNNSGPAV